MNPLSQILQRIKPSPPTSWRLLFTPDPRRYLDLRYLLVYDSLKYPNTNVVTEPGLRPFQDELQYED